jgi:hypothetical protein
MVDRLTDLLKIEPYRKEARQLSGWAIFAALLALAAFCISAYVGFGDTGWKLLILGIGSSFWGLLLSGRIAEREQTADILQGMYELSASSNRENAA